MGINTKLHIDDSTLNVLWFNLSFHQKANTNGYPSSKPTGGIWGLTYETQKDDVFFDKMASGEMIDCIKIIISPAKLDTKSKVIELRDVYVLEHRNNFNGVNSDPMKTYIKLSPASMVQDGETIFKHYWKITDPDVKVVAATTTEDPTPNILSIDWINPETKETIQETTYAEKIALTAQIDNPETTSVKITITKEDGSEFENGETELVFEEAVTEDGMVELTALEIKEQWETFKTADIDKLIAKIDHNGYQKKSEALQIVPTSKVLVNFRTGNSYKGDYGFDWLRMGDTGKKGDVFYKDFIGKYEYKKDALGNFVLDSSGKKILTNTFKKDNAEYTKLGKKFEMPKHPIKANDKYVVPVLVLLPNKKATLTLKVEIEGSDAKKIEYKYDNTYFKLDKTEVSHKTVGKKELADDLTIECIKEFGADKFIEVEADGKFAGKLKVMPNDKANRYKADIVFVKVKINIGNGVTTGSTTNEKRFLEKYLNQALIKPNIIEKELDLTADPILNSTYKLNFNGVITVNDISGIHAHLRTEFDRVHTGYNDSFKVFLFGEAGGEVKINRSSATRYYQGYNGAAESINSKAVVLYNTHNTSTTTHETLHAMGLHHSFSNKGDFTLVKNKTDNIMDYSHQVSINRISTWLWQWSTMWANPNVKKE